MTATKTAPAPATYVSGHCAVGVHDRCRGTYSGVTCSCHHHTEPEPEVLEQPPPAASVPTPSSPRRHCASCTCEDPR